jgi:hypothetical protein
MDTLRRLSPWIADLSGALCLVAGVCTAVVYFGAAFGG